MKLVMQPSYGTPFPLAKFQKGHKGQRPEGQKIKGQNFNKLTEAIFHNLDPLQRFHIKFCPKTPHCRRFGFIAQGAWTDSTLTIHPKPNIPNNFWY